MLYNGLPSLVIKDVIGSSKKHNILDHFDCMQCHKTRVGISLIAQLLSRGDRKKFLLPAYNCGSEVSPFLKNNLSIELYRVRQDLSIDLEDLKARITPATRAIYVIHYFGFPHDLTEIKTLCASNKLWLIEDCALSLFSCFSDGRPVGSVGDIALYNYPKMLPVPDGGALVIHNPEIRFEGDETWNFRQPPVSGTVRSLLPFAKRNLLMMLSGTPLFQVFWNLLQKRQPHDAALNVRFPDMPDSYYYDSRLDHLGVSGITRWLLSRFDSEEIRGIRRRNYLRYLERLGPAKGLSLIFSSLPDGACPLHFPVLVANRNEICRCLHDMAIEAIAWWSGYHQGLPWLDYPDACYLKDHVVALPVHQQMKDANIDYISEQLINCMKHDA